MPILTILFEKLRCMLRNYVPQLSSQIEALPSDIPDRMVEYAFVLRELNATSGRVLDVGCTSPYNVIPLILADQNLEVWGIDVRRFKVRHPNFRFCLGDITHTTFPDSYFDRIIAVSTIEHIGLRGRYTSKGDSIGDRRAMLEIARILKKNGSVLVTVPFGRSKTADASHRVYDALKLRELVRGLVVSKEEYYVKDKSGYWLQCDSANAESIDASGGEYPVACLKLLKP